jgi:magnesium-transporting ATPase (P-type)
MLTEQLEEPSIKILFFAGIITMMVGWFHTQNFVITDDMTNEEIAAARKLAEESSTSAWIEGFSIMFACFFITIISTLCNWGKEKQYLKLHDEILNEKVNVVRGQYGLSQISLVTKIVVGDVILIEAGMRIPADCILIEGMDVTVDESMYDENSKYLKKVRSM